MRDSLTGPNGSPSSFAALFETLEGRQLFNGAPPYEHATDNDIAYGSDGSLHVAWYSTQGGSLQYASRSSSGAWGSAVTIDAIPGLPAGTAGVGQYVTLALDSQNRPAVSYFDAYNGDLKFASRATGAWAVSTNIENTSALYPSLVFNGADAPVVSYYMQNTRDLKLARWTGSGWHRQTVDATDDVGRSSSIHRVPGSPDRMAIAYEKTTGGDFKYAEVTAQGLWDIDTVDAVPQAGGGFTSLDFDNNGNPAFSYYDSWTSTLMYANRGGGGAWSTQAISGRISHWSNLWFSPTDNSAHLVYYDVSGNLINHLSKTPTGNWSGAHAELRLGGGNYVNAAFKSDGTIAYTHGSPYSASVPTLGVGVLAGNLLQQPVLSSTPTVVSTSRIDISWTYGGTANSGFKISISTDNGRTFPEERVVTSASARSAQVTGLDGNTRYTFSVRAYNGAGDSTFSNTAAATTPIAPPAAPGGLAANATSASAVNLSWNDVSGETGYTIERAAASTGPWALVAQLGANATSYADAGLASNTTYHYRIRASNGGGSSANATFAPVTTRVAAPANFTAAAQSTSRATLAWSGVSGATGYVVQRLDGTQYATVATLPASATGYSVGGLASNGTYTFRVYATSSSGNSAAVTAVVGMAARATTESTAAPVAQLNDAGGSADGGFGTRIDAKGNLVLSGNYADAGGVGAAVLVDAGTGTVLRRFANPGDVPDDTDGFGMAVALAGGRVAISAPDGDPAEPGRVYIYDDYEDAVPDLILTDVYAGNGFGHTIMAFGDDLLVQVPAADGTSGGEVRRYDLETGQVVATFAAAQSHQLGLDMAVDTASNTVLLTANTHNGGADVTEFNASTGAALRTFANAGTSRVSVAYSDGFIFIGQWDDDLVLQYDRDASGAAPALVRTYTGLAGSRFGSDLGVSGNELLVSAWGETEYSPADPNMLVSGAAYIFDVTTGTLVQRLTDPTPDPVDNFGSPTGSGLVDSFACGTGVGVLGNGQFVLGNPTDDALGLIDNGSVHVF